MKRILVTGAGGFIGSHLVTKLARYGHYVIGVDKKYPEFSTSDADVFYKTDLRFIWSDVQAREMFSQVEEVYALAADMGGMGYIGVPENDEEVLRNNALINLNTAMLCKAFGVKRVVYASSACVYNQDLQLGGSEAAPKLAEKDAIPANPDTGYGWEKLFSEIMFGAMRSTDVRIARFHNIYGPEGTWQGGREKAPAAFCRKIAKAKLLGEGSMEMWGDGNQKRSFCHIQDATWGLMLLMDQDFPKGESKTFNIGTDVEVTMNQLAEMIMDIANYGVEIKHIEGPIGVQARNADLTRAGKVLGYFPEVTLEEGLKETYEWVEDQVRTAYGKDRM